MLIAPTACVSVSPGNTSITKPVRRKPFTDSHMLEEVVDRQEPTGER